MKQAKGVPIRQKLLIPMMLLVIIENILLISVIFGSGLLSYVENKEKAIFYEKVSNRKNYLENEMPDNYPNPGIHQSLVFYYCYFRQSDPAAYTLAVSHFSKCRVELEKGLDSNDKRIYAYYKYYIEHDPRAAWQLAQEGLVTAAQGKGFYVNAQDSEMIKEQHLRKVESSLNDAIESAKIAGLSMDELRETLDTLIDMDSQII